MSDTKEVHCPDCGWAGYVACNPNGTSTCRNMACIRFPYITSLNRAKWDAMRGAMPSEETATKTAHYCGKGLPLEFRRVGPCPQCQAEPATTTPAPTDPVEKAMSEITDQHMADFAAKLGLGGAIPSPAPLITKTTSSLTSESGKEGTVSSVPAPGQRWTCTCGARVFRDYDRGEPGITPPIVRDIRTGRHHSCAEHEPPAVAPSPATDEVVREAFAVLYGEAGDRADLLAALGTISDAIRRPPPRPTEDETPNQLQLDPELGVGATEDETEGLLLQKAKNWLDDYRPMFPSTAGLIECLASALRSARDERDVAVAILDDCEELTGFTAAAIPDEIATLMASERLSEELQRQLASSRESLTKARGMAERAEESRARLAAKLEAATTRPAQLFDEALAEIEKLPSYSGKRVSLPKVRDILRRSIDSLLHPTGKPE